MKSKIPRFIFVHIMKTAGTTLSEELNRIYKNEYFLDTTYKADRAIEGLFKFQRSDSTYPKNKRYLKSSVLHGHFTVNKYKHLGWPMITFLRDPIERVISNYSSNVVNAVIRGGESVPFDEFCKRTSNTMTYMTDGDLNNFLFVGIVEHYAESLKRLGDLLGHKLNPNSRLNKTNKKVKMGKKQIKIIRSYNKNDIELYKKGLKIFNKN